VVEIEDGIDLPTDDGNECTEEACAEGAGTHAPRALGEACGKGGVCNGNGKCGACLPGKRRCEGNALAVCGGEGEWSRAFCPDPKPVCNRAACVGVARFALGGAHSCARLEDGTVRCFGSAGRLGDDGVLVHVSGVHGAQQIALGEAHSCALVGGGMVVCWGANVFGQLGDGATASRGVPMPVPGLSGATHVAAGAEHSCALVAGGEVKCWGRNDLGQLGDGARPKRPAQKRPGEPAMSAMNAPSAGAPVVVAGLEDALGVTLGGRHGCASRPGGRLVCWGEDDAGQLGGGGPASPPPKPGARPAPPPKLAAAVGVKGAIGLALGAQFGCALLGDGTVRCWGDNGAGQLGDGTTAPQSGPVAVTGLAGATALALGAEHGCAIVEGGAVRCWGKNDRGQLGDGTREPRTGPVSVAGLAGVRALAAGGGHTCAQLADGTLRCWGENGSGEVGDGTSDDRPAPVPVAW
jgi:alpha-tubulin suppressor-like RCC1 family protein